MLVCETWGYTTENLKNSEIEIHASAMILRLTFAILTQFPIFFSQNNLFLPKAGKYLFRYFMKFQSQAWRWAQFYSVYVALTQPEGKVTTSLFSVPFTVEWIIYWKPNMSYSFLLEQIDNINGLLICRWI